MKKFLSLVLALVMTMSLVTVSAGAKDFTDSDKLSGEVYEEAVNVMSEMGIIDGYSDGDFRPQGTLTRGAAAKIIACMMLGKTTAEALGTQAAPFKDVPAGSTFAGYIAYCVEAGLIDGYADGTFRPSGTLTGFAFLKMLLTSLGYDSSIEGYTGTNWTVNVASRATQIGLTDGNDEFVGTRAATREEACLYAVNTLKATLVEYENKGQEITVSDGTVINVRPSAPTYVTSNIAGAATSIDDTWDNTTHDYTVEFAEKYQPDLELDGTTDAFGRPSHTWTWKNDEIGTYVDYDKMVAEYTTKVTGRDLYDLLGKAAIEDCREFVYIDGVDDVHRNPAIFDETAMVRSNTKTVGATGNGVLTQVFHDTRADEITVAIINTYLATATDDYDEDDEVLDVDVYGYDYDGTKNSRNIKDLWDDNNNAVVSDMEADIEDVAVSEYVEDDMLLVRIADGVIEEVMDPETLSGATLTAFSLTKNTITTDGTTYDEADTRLWDWEALDEYTAEENLKDLTYNVYLDPYGYFIGIELVEDPDQYVFITGYEPYSKNLSNAIADAGAIFLDGSMDTIDVKVNAALRAETGTNASDEPAWNAEGDPVLNRWYTYTVDSNNVYTLKPVAMADNTDPTSDKVKAGQFAWVYTDVDSDGDAVNKDVDKSHISLPGWAKTSDETVGTDSRTNFMMVYGNDDSVYINASTEEIHNASNYRSGTGDDAVIIDDVDTVSVGIRNTDMSVISKPTFTEADRYDTSAGVYTLYDNDGYVIAAIVVGTDAAASTNYAYVISENANMETYSADEDEHIWTREVIIDGELVEVTEVGDSLTHLGLKNGMEQGQVWKLSYNADDEVTGAELVATAANHVTVPSDTDGDGSAFDGQVIFNDLEAVEGNDDVVMAIVDLTGTNNKLSLDRRTLWTDEARTHGFAFTNEAKAVLIEHVDGDYYDTVTYYDSKEDNVEDAFNDLNTNFKGYIYAVFEDGVATSIIFHDMVEQVTESGSGVTGTDRFTRGNATLVVDGTGLTADDVRISGRGNVTYTFGVPTGNAGKDVSYDYEVYVDDSRVDRGTVKTTVSADNDVDGSVNIYDDYDEGAKVVVYIDNVTYSGASDEEITLTFDLSNVRLNIGGKAYSNGDTYDVDAGTIVEATIVPTSDAVADKMVLDESTLTAGAGNDVTVSGTTLTIIADKDGTVVVDYIMDTYDIDFSAVTAPSGWTLDKSGIPAELQAGETFSFTLTQVSAGDRDDADVTLTGIPSGTDYSVDVDPGVAVKNAQYTTVRFTSVSEFANAVDAGTLYTDNENNEADGTLATLDDYATNTDFYVLTSGYVAPERAVVTVTVTMPTEDVTVTAITVA